MRRLLPLLTWLALPVYLWQGVGVRLKTERLHPPPDPATGALEGRGDAVRILVVGDSSAASVGAERAGDGLASNLARIVNGETGRPVIWRAAGFNSATTGQIRDFAVPNLAREPWSHVVIAAGTNDAKNFHSAHRFKKDFGGLLYALKARFPEAQLIWSPVVDMTLVPALPRALGRILEIRAGVINRMGERLCRERFALVAERLPITDPERGFASDGFHASAPAYRAWAEHLAPLVLGSIEATKRTAARIAGEEN